MSNQKLIPPHGGYKKLESYKAAVIIYDGTVFFCDRYMTYTANKSYRTCDQMVQAARSGKQNIAEGSLASGTSKKTELKLIGVTRASFGELLEDYEARKVRSLAYTSHKSYTTYKTYIENKDPGIAANTLICITHQANYLLDQQLRALEKEFLEKGGFTKRLYLSRQEARRK